jgi:hypothetical protein
LAADDVAFGSELLVGEHDGVPGDPEVGRERPGRRQACRRSEAPTPDRGLERAVDAAVERTTLAVQVQEQHLAPIVIEKLALLEGQSRG